MNTNEFLGQHVREYFEKELPFPNPQSFAEGQTNAATILSRIMFIANHKQTQHLRRLKFFGIEAETYKEMETLSHLIEYGANFRFELSNGIVWDAMCNYIDSKI
jgi:hypothetical protein